MFICVSFQLYGKHYYQPEHYVSQRMLEKLALPNIREELPRIHANHVQMQAEDAETEYLKVSRLNIKPQPYACKKNTKQFLTVKM